MKEYQVERESLRRMQKLDEQVLFPLFRYRPDPYSEAMKERMKRLKREVGNFMDDNRDAVWRRGAFVSVSGGDGAFGLIASVYWDIITPIVWNEDTMKLLRDHDMTVYDSARKLHDDFRLYRRNPL